MGGGSASLRGTPRAALPVAPCMAAAAGGHRCGGWVCVWEWVCRRCADMRTLWMRDYLVDSLGLLPGSVGRRKQLHETRQSSPPPPLFFYFFSLSLSHPLPLLMTTLWPIGMGYAGVGALSSAGPKREGFNGCFTSAQLGSRLCLDVSSRSDGCMCEHR